MRTRNTLLLSAAILAAACGVMSPEEQILAKFFRASRLIDNTVLADLATVSFDPRTDGSVQQFQIIDFGPESTEGSLVSKQVTLTADVHTPDGRTVPATLTATFQRRDGRWIITALQQKSAVAAK